MGRDPKERAVRTPVSQGDEARKRRNEKRRERTGFVEADWGGVEPGALQRLVSTVTSAGFAVMLGYTRDRSVYTVRIVGDDEAPVEYIRPSEDVDMQLAGIASIYE